LLWRGQIRHHAAKAAKAAGRTTMSKSTKTRTHVSRRTVTAGLGASAMLAGAAPFNIVRAQGAPLKVGMLLPRSGYQAGIGQDCQRGVDITNGILKELG